MPSHRNSIFAMIQARMSSQRLPGKVLKPLAGRTILEHVVDAARAALGDGTVIVATSTDPSDDPIASLCGARSIPVSRGPLDDVVKRLQVAVAEVKATAFFRICADSPFYDPIAMRTALAKFSSGEWDLVTNVFPRSFPKGRSVELARSSAFLALDSQSLSAEEREHVFACYYANPGRYRIQNFTAPDDFSKVNLCVDTPEDWQRAENFLRGKCRPAHQFSTEELAGVFSSGKGRS